MIRWVFVVLMCLLAMSFQVSAQNTGIETDSALVLSLTQKGDAYMHTNELDSAILVLDSANNIINRNKIENAELVLGAKNRLGISLAYKQQNRRSIEIFQELKDFYQQNNSKDTFNIQIARLYNNIAINYNLLFDYEQSLRHFDSSLVTFQKANAQFDNQIRLLYLNKALNHLDLSNHQSAVENIEIARLIRLDNPESDPSGYEKMKENMAYSEVLIELNQNPQDILEARSYLKENIALLNKLNPKDQYIGYGYSSLHKTYMLSNDYDSAVYYANETIQFFKTLYGANYTGLITKIADLGKVYSEMGEDEKALQILDSAISIPTPADIDKNVYKAEAHLWKAKVYLKNDALDSLQKDLIQATKLMFPSFSESENIFANPNTDSLFQNPFFSSFFIKKGNLLKGMYDQKAEVAYLKASLDSYILGINLGMRTRKGLAGLRAKSLFASMLTDNFDQAITVAYELYRSTKDPEDFWKIIWLSDLSKAATLKDKIKGKEQMALGLPKSLISKEIDLKSNLLYYEQKVFKESFTKNIRSSSQQDENTKELIQAKAEMELFLEELKRDFPNYYNLEYGNTDASSFNLLKSNYKSTAFPSDKLVIDFYDHKDYYLVSYLHNSSFGTYQVAKDESLENAIDLLQSMISTKAKGDYQRTAYAIYKATLAPILSNSQISDIIIVPDGKLAYIPFELLVNETIEKDDFKNLRYLIKDYTISYQYAFSLINKKQTSYPGSKSNVLALSPDFNLLQGRFMAQSDENTRGDIKFLGNLPNAQKELGNLAILFKGDFLSGELASESQFKNKAPYADIIHLATHSVINENNPMTSQLLLNQDETEDGFLHTYELFNLTLKADLVTLSACNSGYGELQKGEGVISLSRGFMYAGTPNIMMSLWAVPDLSTSELMGSFYQFIHKGQSYEQSLRNAKLEYLANADANTAHPYYWGAFVYIGDTHTTSTQIWLFAILGFVIVLIFVLFIKTRTANRLSKKIKK